MRSTQNSFHLSEQRTEQSADYRPTEGRSTTEEIGIDQQQSVTQEKRIYGAIAQQWRI